MRPEPLILVVDDELDIRFVLKKTLQSLNYAVEEAVNGTEGLTKALELRPDAILMDQRLPDVAGYEVHLHLLRLGVRIPTVLMSGHPGVDELARAAGIQHFLRKPIDYENLQSFMTELLRPHVP